MTGHFAVFDAIGDLITDTTGRPSFIGEATGDPDLPYVVINADWEPEPDIGQIMLTTPGAFRIGIQLNSYGRDNRDALWMDGTAYTLLMKEDQTFGAVRIIFRDADDSPILSRTPGGLIVCNHWYRFVYANEGT